MNSIKDDNISLLIDAASRGVPISESAVGAIFDWFELEQNKELAAYETFSKALVDVLKHSSVVFRGENLKKLLDIYLDDDEGYGRYLKSESTNFLSLRSIWTREMFEALVQDDTIKFERIVNSVSMVVSYMRYKQSVGTSAAPFSDYVLSLFEWIVTAGKKKYDSATIVFPVLRVLVNHSYGAFSMLRETSFFSSFINTVFGLSSDFERYMYECVDNDLFNLDVGFKNHLIIRRSCDDN